MKMACEAYCIRAVIPAARQITFHASIDQNAAPPGVALWTYNNNNNNNNNDDDDDDDDDNNNNFFNEKILLTTMLTIKILFTINLLEKRKTIHSNTIYKSCRFKKHLI